MKNDQKLTSLEQLLDRLADAARDGDRVTLGTIMEKVGHRSFAPLLLVAGLIALSPLSGIPGMPTTVGLLVLLIAGQLLLRREHFWLPKWLLKRTLPAEKFRKVLKWSRRPARFVDRFLRPRLPALTANVAIYVIALVGVLVALAMPAMEVVPLSATIAGAALTAFGLALIAHDGVMALVALFFTTGTIGVIVYTLI